MSERVKLTEENFRVKSREGNNGEWYHYLRMEDGFDDNINYEQLKQQILEDHTLNELLIQRFDEMLNQYPSNSMWSKKEILNEFESLLVNSKK